MSRTAAMYYLFPPSAYRHPPPPPPLRGCMMPCDHTQTWPVMSGHTFAGRLPSKSGCRCILACGPLLLIIFKSFERFSCQAAKVMVMVASSAFMCPIFSEIKIQPGRLCSETPGPSCSKYGSTIHRINQYAVDKYYENQLHYPADRDLSTGQCVPPFDHLGPGILQNEFPWVPKNFQALLSVLVRSLQ